MATLFDVITLSCFAGVVIAFFRLTNHDIKTLVNLLPAAIAFAIANQLGNHDFYILALLLIIAGVSLAIFVIQK